MSNQYISEEVTFAGFGNQRYLRDIAQVNSIVLDFCGIEQCDPGYGFGPDGPVVRPVYILHVIMSGRGKLIKNGRTHFLHEGQAFLIFPGEENYYEADEAEPWKYIWVGFHGFQAEEMMTRMGFTHERPYIQITQMERAISYMQAMLENSELTYVKELTRMSAFFGLLALLPGEQEAEEELLEDSPEKDSNKLYVRMAVSLLTNSLTKQIRVEDVARSIGISRNYLDGIFKKEMGVSPKEFLMSYRMEKATNLLSNTENPVGIIAAEVGYSDPMTFSKIFRSRYHMSPTEFRRAHREENEVI